MKTKATGLAFAIAAICSLAIVSFTYDALADETGSFYGRETTFAGGIAGSDTHIYTTFMEGGSSIHIALNIADMSNKGNISIRIVQPDLSIINCPFTPVEYKLLHSECSIDNPQYGLHNILVETNTVILGDHISYALHLDTNQNMADSSNFRPVITQGGH